MFYSIIKEYINLNEFETLKFLFLCGGSCAELIGLIIYLNEIKYYNKLIEITIVDHEKGWSNTYLKIYFRINYISEILKNKYKDIKFNVNFIIKNLLYITIIN